jgi:hypothetical protein
MHGPALQPQPHQSHQSHQSQQPQQPQQHQQKVPLVLLLDLDGTMIGHIGCVLCEYELHCAGKVGGGTGTAGGGVPKAVRDSIVSRLRYGIVRPYLDQFCKTAAAAGKGGGGRRVELFVYTASEAGWAAFIVPCVEAAIGMRFNRPLFTRRNCAAAPDMRKSLSALRPLLVRALRPRYPALRTPKDLEGCVALVDNTRHVLADPLESARLIPCSTYTYRYVYDVLRLADVDVLHTRFAHVAAVLAEHGMFPAGALRQLSSYQQFAATYYRHLAALVDAAAAPNARLLHGTRAAQGQGQGQGGDTFWLHLGAAISRASRTPSDVALSDADVRTINRELGMACRRGRTL